MRHGTLVGFSVKQFGGSTYFACFRDPEGRRLKRDTNQPRVGLAVEAARRLIEAEFAPAREASASATWDETTGRLTARMATSGNRPGTAGYYMKCVRLVRAAFPDSVGPAAITPAMAAAWRDKTMATPTRTKRLPSAHYVTSILGGLSALWQRWLVEDLKLVPSNPWAGVEPPKADVLPVKYATDEMIDHFYGWLASRFGDWAFPKLFLSAKAYTGCRLMDLCGLASGQLRAGRIVFPADQTKGRKERALPLPPDLFAALDAYKGPRWLWEAYPPGLKVALMALGHPTHWLNPAFGPERLYYWVEALFADYRKAFPGRPPLTSHMFRKRAFTLAWEKGVDARRAAIAYGATWTR